MKQDQPSELISAFECYSKMSIIGSISTSLMYKLSAGKHDPLTHPAERGKDPAADWGSLRADLDRALAEAQQTASPCQSNDDHEDPRAGGEGDRGGGHIPQMDGGSDSPAWQQASWSLSPHIVDPPTPHHTAQVGLHPEPDPAGHWTPFFQAPRGPNNEDPQIGLRPPDNAKRDKVKSALSTAFRQHVAEIFTPAMASGRTLQHIPQVDGGGDEARPYRTERGKGEARPYRLGSSRNRGRGRLVRQTSPTRSDPAAGSQGSQRYAGLSVSQSPAKPALDAAGHSDGTILLPRPGLIGLSGLEVQRTLFFCSYEISANQPLQSDLGCLP